jgi:hypothetical protein
MPITQELVRKHFHYDPETGKLSRGGREVGFQHGKGYLAVSFMGQRFLVHRLIWFYVTGEWPHTIDHKNHIRSDNRWTNLKNTDCQGNAQNRVPTFYTGLLQDVEFSKQFWPSHDAPAGRVTRIK